VEVTVSSGWIVEERNDLHGRCPLRRVHNAGEERMVE
jgi:hypothetical protein